MPTMRKLFVPRVLHAAKDLWAAVALLDALVEMNPRKGTKEFEQLELLTLLVQDYEDRNQIKALRELLGIPADLLIA